MATVVSSGPSETSNDKPALVHRILQSIRAARDVVRLASGSSAAATIASCRTLLSERGEVSGRRGALSAIAAYRVLDDQQRLVFFRRLLDEFSPDREVLDRAVRAYLESPSQASMLSLQAAVEPPRQELFRRFNLAPGGTQALLDMRRDLLRSLDRHPDLKVIDADLAHIFRSWFNRGFLVLQRIDWRTSAQILERLIQYEAVHQITSWRDLRRRLETDRRCYAFFHPALPDEPLIFIEIALTRGMRARVQDLIDPESAIVDPSRADSAIFYSITSCQEGLRGVSFGNFLIKQVLEDLGAEFTRLRTFATLSPVPNFRVWLCDAGRTSGRRVSREVAGAIEALEAGGSLGRISAEARTELIGHCAWHLLCAKRDRHPLDPVARFHLANGARLERLNWLGDTSETGLHRSFGITANYLYRLNQLERNHENYARNGEVVASRALRHALRQYALGSREAPMTKAQSA